MELEKQLIGKQAKNSTGATGTIIGAYVTDSAGLVLVVMVNDNGRGILKTWRVIGNEIEIS